MLSLIHTMKRFQRSAPKRQFLSLHLGTQNIMITCLHCADGLQAWKTVGAFIYQVVDESRSGGPMDEVVHGT